MPYKDPEKQREYERDWVARKRAVNPLMQELRRLAKRDRVLMLNATKVGKPCVDCGNCFHVVAMDFDHRPGTVKVADISTMVRGLWSWEKINDEIAKCDLVCANCHRVRTYERLGIDSVNG